MQCCYREQFAYSLYARFREPKLYRYVVSGDWDLIPARAQTHPKEAAFVHKYARNDTALHRLLRQSGCVVAMDDTTSFRRMEEWKLQAVKALLKANRHAASLTDAFGKTPLHLACMEVSPESSFEDSSTDFDSTSAAIALCIIQDNPLAARLQDTIDQRTPLHYLVARCYGTIPLTLLRQLILSCPAAIGWRDATGDTPISIVEQRADEIHNVEDVLRVLREGEAATKVSAAQPGSRWDGRSSSTQSSRSTAGRREGV